MNLISSIYRLFLFRLQVHGILLLTLSVCSQGRAQDQFQFNQFIHSASAINPAFSGAEDMVNLNIGFRKQWVAIDESPTHYYVSFNGSLSGMKSAFTNRKSLRTSVPRLYQKKSRESGAINHGFGLYVYGDTFGPFHRNGVFLSYAVMYAISDDFIVSAGLQSEFSNRRFNADKVSVYNPDQDAVYQRYASGPGNETVANINAGIMLYGKGLFVGYSVHQLANMLLSGDYLSAAGPEGLHHFGVIGYQIPLGQQVAFQPSALVKYNRNFPLSFDLLAKLKYREVVWGGVSYRYQDAVGLQLGFRMTRKIHINYSFETPISEIGPYARGSHELVLGYRLFRDKVSEPFLW